MIAAMETGSAGLEAVHRYLARRHPELSASERESRLSALLEGWARPYFYTSTPIKKTAESAIVGFWLDPTVENARRCVAAELPVIREAKRQERHPNEVRRTPSLATPTEIGPYTAERVLGSGADGLVVYARHTATGQEVAVKLHPRGDLVAFRLLADDWSPLILRSLAAGWPEGQWEWAAREYADETLNDLLHRRGWQVPPRAEALTIFATACRAVAWLQDRHIYRWSAHTKNVYRVGNRWKIGDLGRCVFFVEDDSPLLAELRESLMETLGREDPDAQAVADWIAERRLWGHPTFVGIFPRNPERERLLKVDQAAMLAGLLVDLLAPRRRWEMYRRALSKHPYCSAHYPVTGNTKTDEALSRILNRAWRGDEGGALLMANANRGEQTVYEDPLELLQDVQSVLTLPMGDRSKGMQTPGIC